MVNTYLGMHTYLPVLQVYMERQPWVTVLLATVEVGECPQAQFHYAINLHLLIFKVSDVYTLVDS